MKRGFSLIETLVVLSIVAVVGLISVTTYSGAKQSGVPRHASFVYLDALKEANLKAKSMENDSSWGVKILPTSIAVFGGDSYASRSSRAKIYTIDSDLSISGPTEIVFSKFSGIPNTYGTTTFSNTYASSSVYLLSNGVIGQQ